MNKYDTKQIAFLTIIRIFVIVPSIVYSQNFEDYDIDQFYKKVDRIVPRDALST
jgi:hypothetical protein